MSFLKNANLDPVNRNLLLKKTCGILWGINQDKILKHSAYDLFCMMVENCKEAVCVFNSTREICFANQQIINLLGCEEKNIIGQSWLNFLKQHIKNKEYPIDNNQYGEEFDNEFQRDDGKILDLSFFTTPIYDLKGNYLGSLAIVTEIKDTKCKIRINFCLG